MSTIGRVFVQMTIVTVILVGFISVSANIAMGYGLYLQYQEIHAMEERQNKMAEAIQVCTKANETLRAKLDSALIPQGSIAEIFSDGWEATKNGARSLTETAKELWNGLFGSSENQQVTQKL